MKKRCHILILPWDSGSRCVRDRLHGGVHVSQDGLSRSSTVQESLELLGMAWQDFIGPITQPIERFAAGIVAAFRSKG